MRTFIAIELEEETKAQLAEVQAEAEKLCRRGNYTPKENFHLTLHFLGEVQEEDLDYLHEAIYETARRNRPFTMTIDKIGFFPRGNKGILWAGIERSNHLQRLFSTLEKSLEQQGFARERKGLSPHITLGREVEPQRNFTDVQRGSGGADACFCEKHFADGKCQKGCKVDVCACFQTEFNRKMRRKNLILQDVIKKIPVFSWDWYFLFVQSVGGRGESFV